MEKALPRNYIYTYFNGILALQIKAGQVNGIPSLAVCGIDIDPVSTILQQPQYGILTIVRGSHEQRSQLTVSSLNIKVNWTWIPELQNQLTMNPGAS